MIKYKTKQRYKSVAKLILHNLFLIMFGIVFIYPFIWLILGCFKTNTEIFTSSLSLPASFNFEAFKTAWTGVGKYTYTTFFANTFKVVIPVVFVTLLSALLVAYGFARFKFKCKKLFFTLMISTMMLPSSVILIPRYMMFNKFGWLDTYLPLIVPCMFGGGPFFIYLLLQFLRGIPQELDEAAKVDGCNSFITLVRILLPLCIPALFSAGVFQFMWTWNDFFNQLIYINSVSKYTVSLGLHMTLDATADIHWNEIFAMSLVSMLPPIIIFFVAQKYLMDGIATSGLKN